MRIMKIIIFHKIKIIENLEFHVRINENHKHIRMSRKNHKNHANHRISSESHENHQNHKKNL